MAYLEAIPSEYFFTKNDPQDCRLGEFNQLDSNIIIQGYPDDEGIRLNGGRPGAALAPNKIREFLYKMTPAFSSQKIIPYNDRGNWIRESDLRKHHQDIIENTIPLYQQNKKVISFGGGHDFGYVDTKSFISTFTNDSVIINFDAHLDVRPDHHCPHSGTSFFRLLNEQQNFHFFEVGIQEQCNSREHAIWLQNKKSSIHTYQKIKIHGWQILKNELAVHIGKKLFISLDMDVFSNAFAPGCSQSWASGFLVDEYLEIQTWLFKHFDVRGLGIYEVSPPLDHDNITAKLAALISHHFMYNCQD